MGLKKFKAKNIQNGYAFRQKMKKIQIKFINKIPFRLALNL